MKFKLCCRLLTFVAVVFLCGAGCTSSREGAHPVAVKVEKIDPDTELPAEYFAYTDRKGREVKHGQFILYYENGTKYIVANFSHGEFDGKCLVHTHEGKVEIEGEYRRGQPWNGEVQYGHQIRKYVNGKHVGTRTD